MPFKLTVEAVSVRETIPGTGDRFLGSGTLSVLLGPAGGQLLPLPQHAVLINPGDPPVSLEAELRFLRAPQDLGLSAGSQVTFTARFRAESVGEPAPPPGKFETVVDVVNVLGSPNGMVIDSQGEFAYLSNGAELFVLDMTTRQLTVRHPLPGGFSIIDDIGPSDSFLALHTSNRAGYVDTGGASRQVQGGPPTGDVISSNELIQGSNINDSAFANGFLYAPSLRCCFEGVVRAASLDGSVRTEIIPGGGHRGIDASPDGSKVVVGAGNALHVIRTVDNTVMATIGVPFSEFFAFLDNDRVAVVNNNDGTVVVVDLTDPTGIPDLIFVDSLEHVTDLEVDATGTTLFVLHRVCFGVQIECHVPEVVVLDLLAKTVTKRILLDQDRPALSQNYSLALTPDGNTLLVFGEKGVFFLE